MLQDSGMILAEVTWLMMAAYLLITLLIVVLDRPMFFRKTSLAKTLELTSQEI